MRIALDIDGVILDFERTMRTYAELYDLLLLKKDGIKNQTEFDYLNRYNWTADEKKEFIDNYLFYATLYKTPLIPLAKEIIEILKIEGHQICFITARGLINPENKDAVIKVLKKNNIEINNIYWGIKDKVSKCKELKIDLIIEDNPNICKELVKNKIKTLYFRDKNSKILKENDDLKEISNLGEVCRHLMSKNNLKNSSDTYNKILKNERRNK